MYIYIYTHIFSKHVFKNPHFINESFCGYEWMHTRGGIAYALGGIVFGIIRHFLWDIFWIDHKQDTRLKSISGSDHIIEPNEGRRGVDF